VCPVVFQTTHGRDPVPIFTSPFSSTPLVQDPYHYCGWSICTRWFTSRPLSNSSYFRPPPVFVLCCFPVRQFMSLLSPFLSPPPCVCFPSHNSSLLSVFPISFFHPLLFPFAHESFFNMQCLHFHPLGFFFSFSFIVLLPFFFSNGPWPITKQSWPSRFPSTFP